MSILSHSVWWKCINTTKWLKTKSIIGESARRINVDEEMSDRDVNGCLLFWVLVYLGISSFETIRNNYVMW